ncbi:MAG: hypothetical protein ACRECA_00220 [Pseudolabrys sp.]
MRRMHRVVMLAALLAITPALAGCEDFDIDKFDVFGINKKKKLPGERKELFPEGVPGVTQGIPPEYMKGNQPPPETAQTPATEPANGAATPDGKEAAPASKTAAVAPAEEPKPKPKPKRKPKPRTTSSPPTQITVQPKGKGQNQQQDQGQQQLEPWPGSSPQPAPQKGQQAPSGQSTSTEPWPTSPPTGTFSR